MHRITVEERRARLAGRMPPTTIQEFGLERDPSTRAALGASQAGRGTSRMAS